MLFSAEFNILGYFRLARQLQKKENNKNNYKDTINPKINNRFTISEYSKS